MRSWPTLGLFAAVALVGCVRSDIAPGVNPKTIKAVRLGMALEEVLDTLGLPYSVQALHGIHDGACRTKSRHLDRAITNEQEIRWLVDSTYRTKICCEGNRRDKETRRFGLAFSRMVDEQGISPMLWVHFDEKARVREVYARLNSHMAWRDDELIYLLKLDEARYQADGTIKAEMEHCDEGKLRKYFSQ
jgi:energy-converting hydrogenase A subunit M